MPERFWQSKSITLEHQKGMLWTRTLLPCQKGYLLSFRKIMTGIVPVSYTHLDVYKRQKLLFGIFCLMLTLVFLYTLTALGFNGNDSAFIILVLAVISLVTGLIFGILGILSSRKK